MAETKSAAKSARENAQKLLQDKVGEAERLGAAVEQLQLAQQQLQQAQQKAEEAYRRARDAGWSASDIRQLGLEVSPRTRGQTRSSTKSRSQSSSTTEPVSAEDSARAVSENSGYVSASAPNDTGQDESIMTPQPNMNGTE